MVTGMTLLSADETTLVTGGTSGLAFAIAQRFPCSDDV